MLFCQKTLVHVAIEYTRTFVACYTKPILLPGIFVPTGFAVVKTRHIVMIHSHASLNPWRVHVPLTGTNIVNEEALHKKMHVTLQYISHRIAVVVISYDVVIFMFHTSFSSIG